MKGALLCLYSFSIVSQESQLLTTAGSTMNNRCNSFPDIKGTTRQNPGKQSASQITNQCAKCIRYDIVHLKVAPLRKKLDRLDTQAEEKAIAKACQKCRFLMDKWQEKAKWQKHDNIFYNICMCLTGIAPGGKKPQINPVPASRLPA